MPYEYCWAYVADSENGSAETVTILNTFGKIGWRFTGYTEDDGYGIRFLMEKTL